MSSEVSYTEFEPEKVSFGDLNTFTTETPSGPVKTSSTHINYDNRPYNKLQLPVVSISDNSRETSDGKFHNNKSNI